jgi:hypothetical protein
MNDEKGRQIKADALIERLVPDPAKPEAKLLSGYLGRSDRDSVWRLYLNLEFNDYLEFAEADIVHVEKLGRDDESQAGAWVWVKTETIVEHVRPERRAVQADFLGGAISSGLLGGAAGAGINAASVGLVAALPRTFSVTECPTDDGKHTCTPAVCTLATSCYTTVPVDKGCGDRFLFA